MINFKELIKNRVKFTRKKKCDVCHEVKLVTYECEECYMKGFDNFLKEYESKMKVKIWKDLLNLINELNLSIYKRPIQKETKNFVDYFREKIQDLIKKYKKESELSGDKK